MTTKVLNKIVNVCTTLSGGESSTSSGSSTSELLQTIYPVGSIYMSMNKTSPDEVLGFGTWQSIASRFLYCVSPLIAGSGNTGGSSTITEAHLPTHTHTFTGVQVTDSVQFRSTANGNVIENSGNNGILSVETDADKTASYQISCEESSHSWEVLSFDYTPQGTLSETGEGETFLPPYMTVYAWYRTA